MNKGSPQKPRLEILLSGGVQAELVVDVRKPGPRPAEGLSYKLMTYKPPRGPPDSTRRAREDASGFSLREK